MLVSAKPFRIMKKKKTLLTILFSQLMFRSLPFPRNKHNISLTAFSIFFTLMLFFIFFISMSPSQQEGEKCMKFTMHLVYIVHKENFVYLHSLIVSQQLLFHLVAESATLAFKLPLLTRGLKGKRCMRVIHCYIFSSLLSATVFTATAASEVVVHIKSTEVKDCT